MRYRPRASALLLIIALAGVLVLGCKTQASLAPAPTTAPLVSPTAAPTTSPEDRVATAEARYLGRMSTELADAVRAQPWFTQMTPDHLALISAILNTERAAAARGESASVLSMLNYAAEQPWYADGLDATEASRLRGVFQIYELSLSDKRAFQIGSELKSTIEYQLVENVDLPASGNMTVLVSSEDEALGRRALDLAIEWLPKVEALVGAFPYSLLHITVTDLGEFLAGVSNDEFVAVDPDAVDDHAIAHELVHSTMYAIFPRWFEEGMAYFLENYLTGDIEETSATFRQELDAFGVDPIIDLRVTYPGAAGYLIDSDTGYLLIKDLYDVVGIQGLAEIIRSLRSQTFTDQQLLKRLAENPDPQAAAALEAVICKDTTGTTHDYCH
jgi:hypothetical protein